MRIKKPNLFHIFHAIIGAKAALSFCLILAAEEVLAQVNQKSLTAPTSSISIFVGPSYVKGTSNTGSELSRIRYKAGVRIDKTVISQFLFESQISFDKKGFFEDFHQTWDSVTTAYIVHELDFNYITLAALAKFRPTASPFFVSAGPYVSCLASWKQTAKIYTNGDLLYKAVNRYKGGDDIKLIDFGLVMSIGGHFTIGKIKAASSLEYSRGLASIAETGDIKNQTLSLLFGLQLK
jgi:hypothetical protein